MLDLEITGILSRDGVNQGDCVWCGKASTSRAFARGLNAEVPCHLLCCAAIIRAAREWMRTGEASPALLAYRERLGRIQAAYLLGDGDDGSTYETDA
jgi:hypothetical protein